MKIAFKFHIVENQFTLVTGNGVQPQGPLPIGEGVVSIGPDGREDDQPIGTHGAYEVCSVNGACLTYRPTPDTQFLVVPD